VSVARVSVARSHPQVRYAVRSETTWQADSAGVPREAAQTATATIAVRVERLEVPDAAVTQSARTARSTGVRARGEVSQFVSVPSERLQGPERPVATLPLTVPFEALLDGGMARVVPVPALANECDRPETAATALARELLVRLPRSLAAGDRWTDTTRTFACRAGVPITVTTVTESTVASVTRNRAVLQRRVKSDSEGELVSPWRTMGVRGQGRGEQTVELGLPSGEVLRLDSRSESTFTLRDSALPAGGAARVAQVTVYEARRM
jgi:hypothetical protein